MASTLFYEIITGKLRQISDSTITQVGAYAFYCLDGLDFVSLPNCQYIDEGGFGEVQNLTSIYAPECLSIGSSAFYYCNNLTTVSFSKCLNIGGLAFFECNRLSSIYFPKCTHFSTQAFQACYNLKTVSFPKCSFIGNYVFQKCYILDKFYFLGSSVPEISVSAFINCPITNSTYLGYYGSIYVLSSMLNSFKTATNWAAISDRIVAYTE